MSTPTPIEIVREHQRWRRAQGQYAGLCQCPHTPEEIGLALDSVLRDAERFNALELALTDDRIFVSTPDPHDDDLWAPHDGTLAELADRLGVPLWNEEEFAATTAQKLQNEKP